MTHYFDITAFVSTLGYVGILSIIFLESAVFFCFFFPGDSLLFAAGFLAAKGVFALSVLIPAAAAAAIIGYMLAYFFGIKLGKWLLKKNDSFWYKRSHIDKAHVFYKNHGGKAIVLARLMPIVRTFMPIVAGIVKMNYKRYSIYNIVGGVIWATVLPITGFYLGTLIPSSKNYILPAVLVIVLLSISPTVIKWWRDRRQSHLAN